MNLKTLIGFLAGAAFVLALLVTCGTGGKGGPRTASAGGDTIWEYATYHYLKDTVDVPATATAPKVVPCGNVTCGLNAMGADGWELVTVDNDDNYYFKRIK